MIRAGVISNAIAFISQPREERNRGIEFRGILLVSKRGPGWEQRGSLNGTRTRMNSEQMRRRE